MGLLKFTIMLFVVVWAKSGDPQPHTGGPQSKQASMLVVDFFEVSDGRSFREMVEDIQTMLLTGGIHTNIFRPKLARGRTERPQQVIMYVDGR